MVKMTARIEKFWLKVAAKNDTDCREWQGCKVSGYGRLFWHGRRTYAHRVAYELTHGSIPPGRYLYQVLHTCDNSPCCEPSHLYLGTPADNMRDRDMRGRNGHKGKAHVGKDHAPRWDSKGRRCLTCAARSARGYHWGHRPQSLARMKEYYYRAQARPK